MQGVFRAMIATVINAASVILGSLIGLVLGKYVTAQKQHIVMTGAGIVTVLIGIYMGLKTTAFVELVLALIIGGLIGSALRIEDSIEALGNRLEQLSLRRAQAGTHTMNAMNTTRRAGTAAITTMSETMNTADTTEHSMPASMETNNNLPATSDDGSTSKFGKGFLNASVLFCAGAMTILGAIEAGVNRNYTLLLTKSVLDGFMAIVFASMYGIGVAFSALTILVYQGILTWLGIFLEPVLSDVIMTGISGVGGCLVLMIGLNLLKLTKIKTADFLPALIMMPLILVVSSLVA